MSLLDEDTLKDIALAQNVITNEDVSVVVVDNGKIWRKKKGQGIRPFLEVIEEMGDEIHGSVIGDRILGRASALLCCYSKVRAVYSPQATKAAIALLIMGSIPAQVDKLIPFIKNHEGSGLCPFEKMLENIDEPKKAYNFLKEKVLK
ncbi:MAG: hypothetical protein BV456_12390 [Thermoplasmata archaeon M8B2D]|nr:MAG: hypothetical protein BV456_12390 [Thermoplasmata archaeon M8B2D]